MIPLVSAATGLALILRFIVPQITADHWKDIDKELSEHIRPLHHDLSQNLISAPDAGNQFNFLLQSFFKSKPDLFLPDDSKGGCFIRREKKTLNEIRRQKNKLRKKAFRKNATADDREKFYECLHAYDYLKNEDDANEKKRTTEFEEKRYRSNFWDFSKNIVNDTLYEEPKYPSFSKAEADTFYTNRYENQVNIDQTKLNWFPFIPETLENDFDMSPIRPRDIKKILQSKSPNSAPGPDGVVYGLLKKLPCTQHFMATLFTKRVASG